MKRHSFRTKNILETHSLVYISIMLLVLLIFFLVLGNVGKIITMAKLDSGEADAAVLKEVLAKGPETMSVTNEKKESVQFAGGNGAETVALFGDQNILTSLSSQLMVMDQSFETVADLGDLKDYELLVIAKGELSGEELRSVSAYLEAGGNVWVTGLSEQLLENETAKELFGIKKAGKAKVWPGIRFSGDLALGSVMEDPRFAVSAADLKLSEQTKLFACALPKRYQGIESKDLPPLIWRFVPKEDGGSVYICNGDFMQTEVIYCMLPTILAEVNENYVYGILNAYCVFAEDMPYAENEERESWMRLYSRDKMTFQQDLLSAQYLRYYNNYGARITYFSGDYESFRDTNDRTLRYYTDTIESSMGLLARKDAAGLSLGSENEKLKITDWTPGFAFTEDENYCLPVDYSYSLKNKKEKEFCMLSGMIGLGYYAFTSDADEVLDYDGQEDIWDEYCKHQETVLGIGQKFGSWLERMTASQAVVRIDAHLRADTRVQYHADGVDITTDAEKDWMILKGKAEEIEINGGTAQPIGERCWLIEVNSPHAAITFH